MGWYKDGDHSVSQHIKGSLVEKTDFDSDSYTPLKTMNDSLKGQFDKNEKKYYEFISWARWYPDLFLDMLRPRTELGELGGINLHFDQRVFLRATMRFFSMYGVFPRGWGKTFCEEAGCFVACILYPGLDIALTAQNKTASANLLKEKYIDLTSKYPLLKSEILDIKQGKDEVEYIFINGSRISNLANSDSSKGLRRHRIMIEESALLNDVIFEDALKPIVEIGRMTKGKLGITDPLEPNGQIHFFTTAGWRNSSEWNRNMNMYNGMLHCNGDFVVGADWKLASWLCRGRSAEQILKDKKKSNNALAFAKNYESKWVGATDNQLIEINKLMNIRTLSSPVLDNNNAKREIILSMDVARSANDSNNKSAISVLEEIHDNNGQIRKIKLINMFLISNQVSFTSQALSIKRIQRQYKAKLVIVDANGLGRGLIDELFERNFDPRTDETFEAWTTDNPDYCSEYEDALPILYPLIAKKGNSSMDSNSNIITKFIGCVEGKKLELLEKRKETDFDLTSQIGMEKYAPYEQTDALIDEISNLKLEILPDRSVRVKQVLGRINKDRYSSLAYGIWWILTFDDKLLKDDSDLFMDIAKMNYNSTNRTSNLQNIFK